MKKAGLILFCCLIWLGVGALEKKDYQPMKTSIIVPCYYTHFCYIPELLDCYQNQTVLPDEIIISLTTSQCDKIPVEDFEFVVNTKYPFVVKIVFDPGELPGRARNVACEASMGDLLICQDADDIPHPQRTEIIKNLFENYKVDFLIHRWIHSDQAFKMYSAQETQELATYFEKYYDITWDYIHNGNIALRREVFELVKWPDTYNCEDVYFNMNVFRTFEYKVGINEHLMIYRVELSSYKHREGK